MYAFDNVDNNYYGRPLTLNIFNLTNQREIPFVDVLLERLYERRVLHRRSLDDVIVQQRFDVVDGRQDAHSRVLVDDEVQVDSLPVALHLTQRLDTQTDVVENVKKIRKS